ncbi:MAG: GatB/YqeY domain-containing protein [Candidatus Saccharimonadales bacterium]|jgi:hypothetical protein
MLQEQIMQDLKVALLAGDAERVSVLRSVKSAVTYAEVARGVKGGAGLSDSEILEVISKESKKRQESADLFTKGGATDRASKELREKLILDKYLPEALSTDEIANLVDQAIDDIGELTPQTMGRVIGRVKELSNGAADGGVIAGMVKERMGQ